MTSQRRVHKFHELIETCVTQRKVFVQCVVLVSLCYKVEEMVPKVHRFQEVGLTISYTVHRD